MDRGKKAAIFLFSVTLLLVIFRGPLTSSLKALFARQEINELETSSYVNFIKSQDGKYNPAQTEAIFQGEKIRVPGETLATVPPQVLGQTSEEKWIEVDLSEQRLYAHEGDRVVFSFLVSTGKPWTPTPTGEFRIWIKLRYSTMSGGSKEDGSYYYLPNVPYVMYFYKGYGLHGTYWHNNFGQRMSRGCVNLSVPDAEKLFWWVGPQLSEGKTIANSTKDNPGTKVVVHD